MLGLIETEERPRQRATPPVASEGGRVRSALALVALLAVLGVLLAVAVGIALVGGDTLLRRAAGA